jgi:phospholipid-translocating ATPase
VVTLLVSAAALIPFFTYAVIKTWFFPDYHNKIQWRLRHHQADSSNADTDEFGQVLRQSPVRSTGVGVSARRDLLRLNSNRSCT